MSEHDPIDEAAALPPPSLDDVGPRGAADAGDHDAGDHDAGDHDAGDHDAGDHDAGDHDGVGDRDEASLQSAPGSPVIVGVSFDGRIRAQEFLLAISRLRQAGDLDLQDAVIVDKSDDGKLKVTETIDPSPGRAALSGAVWTGLLGLFLGGPVGWLAGLGIGAGAGAVTAKVVDLGIPDDWVDWFKAAVRPSSSTVVLLLDDINMPSLLAEAERFSGAELVHSTMSAVSFGDLAEAFEHHRDPR